MSNELIGLIDGILSGMEEKGQNTNTPICNLLRDCKAALQPSLPQDVEPVAWHTEDHLTDRSATTYDRECVERWLQKGWPVTPMYYSHEGNMAALPQDAEECSDRLELAERIEEIHINVHGRVVIRYAGGRCEDVTDDRGKVIYRPETSAITTLPDLEEWIGENAFAMQVDGEIVGRGIHEEDFRAFLAGKVLVPVEPTKEMVVAGHHAAWRRIPSIFDFDDAENVYKAMLSASKGE